MDQNTLMSDKVAVVRMHWTAPICCVVSVFTAPLCALQGAVQLGVVVVSPTAPPYRVVPPLLPVIQVGFEWLLLVLSFLVFPFACVALDISSRPQWRKGRWPAVIGLVLPGIVLVLYGALLVYLLFFWHPHVHFVG